MHRRYPRRGKRAIREILVFEVGENLNGRGTDLNVNSDMPACGAPFVPVTRNGQDVGQYQAIRRGSKTTVLDLGDYDVSPENDGSFKLEYDGSFGGPRRKERTHEAVEVLGGADPVRDSPGRSRHLHRRPLPAALGE